VEAEFALHVRALGHGALAIAEDAEARLKVSNTPTRSHTPENAGCRTSGQEATDPATETSCVPDLPDQAN
jgi:hypothetical protein